MKRSEKPRRPRSPHEQRAPHLPSLLFQDACIIYDWKARSVKKRRQSPQGPEKESNMRQNMCSGTSSTLFDTPGCKSFLRLSWGFWGSGVWRPLYMGIVIVSVIVISRCLSLSTPPPHHLLISTMLRVTRRGHAHTLGVWEGSQFTS